MRVVQAAHDGSNLVMRFQWPANPHTPVPFADGGKMDPENAVKLAMLIDQGKVDCQRVDQVMRSRGPVQVRHAHLDEGQRS